MKLIPFTYTNQYDRQTAIHINPDYVISLRPEGSSKTIVAVTDGTITVDGTIEVVSAQLCGDDQPEENTSALDKMPDSG